MINRIEDINNSEDLGFDCVSFHVFLTDKSGKEIPQPIVIAFFVLTLFIKKIDRPAAAYIEKVRKGIRSYGNKDSQIIQILRSEDFPIDAFVEKFIENYGTEPVSSFFNINVEDEIPTTNKLKIKSEYLQPAYLAANNARVIMFSEAIDEEVKKNVALYYPNFFENVSKAAYKKYDNILMDQVNNLVRKLDEFLINESQK